MLPDLATQTSAWNAWNTQYSHFRRPSQHQWAVLERWLGSPQRPRRILDVGCGNGWLLEKLLPYGSVTGTDLADEVVTQLQMRFPKAVCVAGDFMALPFPAESYDLVTSCEVLSHVADQPAFVAKLASLLQPSGELLLATQNRWALERNQTIPPPPPSYIRNWVTARQLRSLLTPHFRIVELRTIGPFEGSRGVLRLINSTKVTTLSRSLLGEYGTERWKGALGAGWTIMCRAMKQ